MRHREPRFGYGQCPACQRKVALRADGRIRVHYLDRMSQCGGSGRNPVSNQLEENQ